MIVADTNLLVYLLLPGDHSDAAEQVWRKDKEWAVPPLWRSEFRNVLALYLRKNLVSRTLAIDAFGRAETAIRGREYPTDTGRVLELVERSTCSASDCEFVALAQELTVPLVTSDSRILRNFPQLAVTPGEFAA